MQDIEKWIKEESEKFIYESDLEQVRKIVKMSSISKTAERFGIPYRTLQNWLNGKTKAPAYVLRMICHISTLETHIEYLSGSVDFNQAFIAR